MWLLNIETLPTVPTQPLNDLLSVSRLLSFASPINFSPTPYVACAVYVVIFSKTHYLFDERKVCLVVEHPNHNALEMPADFSTFILRSHGYETEYILGFTFHIVYNDLYKHHLRIKFVPGFRSSIVENLHALIRYSCHHDSTQCLNLQ